MRIVVGGDICPIGRNESLFCEKINLLAPATNIFKKYDIVIANLECPLVEKNTPIQKGGPVLGAPTDAAKGLATLGIDIVNLGNNHILDHGKTGLAKTLESLKKSGIKYVGAGLDLESSQRPFFIDNQGVRIAILAFTECEYSYANSKRGGASPFNINTVVRQLTKLPSDYFKLILLHGGNEHFPFPSPQLQDTCRLMIELGANAVICQHSHCIGAYEKYQEGLIVYGQGNLAFDLPSKRHSWWEGILVILDIKGKKLYDFSFVPILQNPGESVFRTLDDPENRIILEKVNKYNRIVCDSHRLEKEWKKFCQTRQHVYQSLLFGHNRLGYLLNKIVGVSNLKSRSGKMNIGNVLRCFSHLEAIRTIYSLEATTKEKSK